jgi:NADH-quinone oxidoreductase subunit G
MDAVGSNIRVDTRGAAVMRVLPVLNEDINEEWISDKTRYACDGLRRQRLDTPFVRRDGALSPASWDEAFAAIASRLRGMDGAKIAAIAGDLADAEAMCALKDLMDGLGSPNIDCRQDGAALGGGSRAGWLFNTTIAGIEDADALLIVGSDPRREAPILNARIRKRWLRGGFKVGVVGPDIDLTYSTEHLGAGPQTLKEIADGNHPFCETLKAAGKPMIIVGQGALARADGAAVLAAARKIAEDCGAVTDGWNGFNVLHTAAARVGGLELGLLPGKGGRDVAGILDGAFRGEIEAVYLLGADEIPMERLGGKAFVIYQGHHGDAGAHRADVILPGAAYTEKNATYVNTEGRAQRGRRAVFPPGEAREDWTILRALSDPLGRKLPYDDIFALRRRMAGISPVFDALGEVVPAEWGAFGVAGPMDDAPFTTPITNFYMTDPISRASETMAACSRAVLGLGREATGTDG